MPWWVRSNGLKAAESANMAVFAIKEIKAELKGIFASAHAMARREAVLYWN